MKSQTPPGVKECSLNVRPVIRQLSFAGNLCMVTARWDLTPFPGGGTVSSFPLFPRSIVSEKFSGSNPQRKNPPPPLVLECQLFSPLRALFGGKLATNVF